MQPALERRFTPNSDSILEVRSDGDVVRITGLAAPFNSFSSDLGGFREIIRPGAFARAISENSDVRALVDHDPSRILGRTKSGTLTLRETDKGLAYEIAVPDTTAGRDIVISIKRGDVSGSSFAFRAVSDLWRTENGQPIRELHSVELYDVSPVTYPAYPMTEAAMRSLNAWQQSRQTNRQRLQLAAMDD